MSIETGSPSPEEMGIAPEEPTDKTTAQKKKRFIGVIVGEDGTLDMSHAAVLVDRPKDKESEMPYVPVIPRGWTVLKHGSSVDRWGDINPYSSAEIEMTRPLSVISQEMYERDKRHGPQYDTTATYAGTSKPFEIRVLFYKEHDRVNLDPEYRATLDPMTMDRIATYYHRNIQSGRHPLVPKGEVLRKLGHVVEGGRDVFYFVPESIEGAYRREAGLE